MSEPERPSIIERAPGGGNQPAPGGDPELVRTAPSGAGLSSPRSRRNSWLAGFAAVLFLTLGVWLVSQNLTRWLSAPAAPAATAPAGAAGDIRRIHATLFYVAADGGILIPASREVLYGATPAEQVHHIVSAAVEAPPPGFTSAIPAGTTVRSVFLTPAGEAYVDLGGTIVSGHPGGSLD
ncbi:MAG: GerMN domain-containing protein, partial [Acidobacteriota bacterium]